MQNNIHSMMLGTGVAIPEKILTNLDLEKIVDTNDEWIRERTGIKVRHVADDKLQNSDLASEAARNALADARMNAEDIDTIIVATVTGDVTFPSTACYVQQKIGAVKAAAFDIQATCSGFLFALSIADGFIASGKSKNTLIVGSELLTRIVDWKDRSTCVLFGDAAGAAVISSANGDGRGVLGTFIKTDGSLGHLLWMPGGGTRFPADVAVSENLNNIKMEGPEVFKAAVTAMGDAATHILDKTGLTPDDIKLLIPHQANTRIINATAKRLKLPEEKVYVNIQEYGNTSAASIPVALHEAKGRGLLEPGDACLMVAFGGGFTWGSAIVRV
ncbi:ketoacyl-ACP synthase III [candidate division KSB1 bacterium]|nr:ketoacyl-ACP synthase III [candidate division KSB1 bacterium]NIR71853.1 ketoacyl-ACP synthase III [candidate division KSB1 bacterium]NIS25369.1 ketoacyl-ACP synthase III [candidate division KSB1 bacterium]NIT71839.1 ketoacyl-ACP synthase III [candidate division KSB1 bacterium]NIU25577.1 ketoacyl-ACP synthase III [candidate division KSB1 bacterium]